MRRTLNTALTSKAGQYATVQGWIHRRRRLGAVSFLILRDRSGLAQVVLAEEDERAQLDGLTEETVVSVEGLVTANAKAPGGVELIHPAHYDAVRARDHAPSRAVATVPGRQPARLARPRAGAVAPPHPASLVVTRGGVSARIPQGPRRPGLHRNSDPQAGRQGQMALRWCAAGMVEAGTQFRRVNGHLRLRALRTALQRQVAADNAAANEHNRISNIS